MIKKVILYITIILFIFFAVHEVFQYIKNKESLKTKVTDNFLMKLNHIPNIIIQRILLNYQKI